MSEKDKRNLLLSLIGLRTLEQAARNMGSNVTVVFLVLFFLGNLACTEMDAMEANDRAYRRGM